MELSRERYAQLYGPTVGDRIRLADTDLLIEVTEDRCGGPGRAGDEAVFGGGKVLRESMGQGRATRAEGAPDLIITGAVVLDHWYLARMLEAMDPWPVNVALLGKGNTVSARSLEEQLRAGASGLKLHEDWGTTPAAIDAALTAADRFGVQVALHSDTLNEAGFVEDTLAAIAGRGIHAYHTEGAGGGHAPDIITVASHPNVLPSSTNPIRPHTVNTLDEHLDMLMVCHHLNPSVPEDLAFAESRIRPSTIAAEDLLHDLGAISMIGSDAQAMGRVGEVVLRTWQTAHVMKRRRGALPGDGPADNLRRLSVHFVAPVALETGLASRLAVSRPLLPVADVRGRTKADLPENTALPRIEVEPDTFTVRVDGEVWEQEPATELPMAQRYFLF